jgi:hypothetical protein
VHGLWLMEELYRQSKLPVACRQPPDPGNIVAGSANNDWFVLYAAALFAGWIMP